MGIVISHYSKFSDIDAVISKAYEMLPKIEGQYLACLKEKKIPDSLLVDIKDYLGNLRTALDYIWHKIPNVYDGHFPVANSKMDFLAKVKGIDSRYTIILEKYQDYSPKGWIRCFNLFRNKNVHVTLIPQKRVETPAINIEHNNVSMRISGGASVQIGHGASISLGGATIAGGQTISPKSNYLIGDPKLNIKKEIWVDYIFDGSSISTDFPENISVLKFLKASFHEVKNIISIMEKEL